MTCNAMNWRQMSLKWYACVLKAFRSVFCALIWNLIYILKAHERSCIWALKMLWKALFFAPKFESIFSLHYRSNCIFFIATIAIKYLSQKNLLFLMNVLVIPTFEFLKCCIVKTASNISFRICFIQNQFVEKCK